MVMTPRERFFDRRWFCENLLYITDKDGRFRRLGKPRVEQIQIIEAWDNHPNVCVLKPRQVGSSTITQALSFRDALLCPDPISILTLAHESGACNRMNQMLRGFWRGLPQAIRPPLSKDNASELVFGHNGASMMQYMAGGRGQGRSRTYQQAIFTEMAFYPQGSASVKGKTDADRDAWASVLATMHKSSPYYKLVVESTGDGPGGQFHDIVLQAQEDPNWAFLFFRWCDFPMYEMDIPGFEMRPDEREFAAEFLHEFDPATVLRKMAWRRHKMETEGYSLMRLRREYPTTAEEPFLLHESTWFDGELANRLIGRIPAHWRESAFGGALRVYHEHEEGRTYFIGGDTAGGTGRDYAVFVVLRDDFEVCAVWQSNTAPPHEQGNKGAELAALYGGAMVCCEENNYGRTVNDRMEALGTQLHYEDNGKRFWSQGGRAGQTKKKVYSYARHLFNTQQCCSLQPEFAAKINDEPLLQEIMAVRENDRGNIECPEPLHDDLVDAWVLALWCGRRYAAVIAPPETEEDVQRRRLQRMGLRL